MNKTDEWMHTGISLRESPEKYQRRRVSANHKHQDSQSAERLEMAVRIAGIGHFKWDALTGNCLFCSEQHAAHFGLSPEAFIEITRGRDAYLGFVYPDDQQIVLDEVARVDSGVDGYFEYRVVRPDGEIRFLRQINETVYDENNTLIEVVGASIDMTDLRQAEARIRQSQRIEAIGTLTGGVAHDFNNLLGVIVGSLELALETDVSEARNKLINQAIGATNHGSDLTQKLLSFAGKAHLRPTKLDLNQIVMNTMSWCGRVLPATVELNAKLADSLAFVCLDKTSAENAIINLLLNARDSMPHGGVVNIETSVEQPGSSEIAAWDSDTSPGQYVSLTIRDSGHGIDAEKLEKIFDPFFTTKTVGKGSGLGLSMVQGFVNQSGGVVRVSSEVDVGTTIKLYFPIFVDEALKTDDVFVSPVQQTAPARILVTDDNEIIVSLIEAFLTGEGHTVLTAYSAHDAIRIFEQTDHVDLLITDITMPGKLQGPGLAKYLRQSRSDIPVLYISGNAKGTETREAGLCEDDAFITKPFKKPELLQMVNTLLNAKPDV